MEPDTYNPLTRYFLDAAAEMGYPRVDLNAPYTEGNVNALFKTKLRFTEEQTKIPSAVSRFFRVLIHETKRPSLGFVSGVPPTNTKLKEKSHN